MKKALVYISIFLGVVLFAFFALVVIMMLAPGTTVFGVKYVSAVVGKYEKTISQTITTKDIHINTGKVPVTVHFGDNSPLGVQFVQHFQGFSKASDWASVKLTNKDGKDFDPSTDNAVYISVTEYKKFIWARDNVEFYLNINLPAEYANSNSIYINSESSSVKFVGGKQSLKNLSFSSAGGLNISNNLTISNSLTVNTQRYLELAKNVTINGDLNATVTNENLKIENPVGGNLSFTSGSGDLYFNTCNNLSARTGSGSITKPYSGQVNGNVNIVTNVGNVEIGSVLGTINKIQSRTGFIKIDKCLNGNLEISTNRSTVTLGQLKSAKITTTTGDISITSVAGDLSATASASGNIVCGKVGGNAVVTTKLGDITFTGAIEGDLNLTTNSGKIKMVSCKNLTLKSTSGNLKPSGVQINVLGNVKIEANSGEILLGNVSGDARINTNTGAVSINTIGGKLTYKANSAPLTVRHVKQAEDVSCKYSHIYIGSAVDGVKINTSGNVRVGELGNVGLANIKAGNGQIDLKNTTAKVDISANGNISFTNYSSTDIRINRTANIGGDDEYSGRGSVTAVNLKGTVKIYSAGDVNVKADSDLTLLRINTESTSRKVTMEVNKPYNKIEYWLSSDKGSKCRVFNEGTQLGEAKSTIKSPENLNQNQYKIVVFTTYAEIDLKLKQS